MVACSPTGRACERRGSQQRSAERACGIRPFWHHNTFALCSPSKTCYAELFMEEYSSWQLRAFGLCNFKEGMARLSFSQRGKYLAGIVDIRLQVPPKVMRASRRES